MLFSKLLYNKISLLSLNIRNLTTTSCKYKSHYETLKLSRDCSFTEIRNAYLKLSKQYHPDRNKDDNSHKEFIKISEAYNVLSKPLSRRDYDLELHNKPAYGNRTSVHRTPHGVWTDETFWEHRDQQKDSYYRSQAYYGVRGIKKMSNMWIVFLCLGFTTFGVLLQILAVRKSFTLRRDQMNRRSAELEKLHSEIRARALANGNKKQLELLIEKLNKDKIKTNSID